MADSSFDLWQLFGGIGMFLFGMMQMEHAIDHLAGRSFKVFLRDKTKNPLSGILAGLVVTAASQSSSIVNLLVLAFVGARILQMKHAIAIILGSNLGSTVYNWIVVFIGFKFDIQSFAMPMLALGGLVLIFFREKKLVMHWTTLAFGLSLLFVGLAFIKTGMEGAVKEFDLTQLNEYNSILFVLAGFIFTAIVQSSSTIVVLSLSALNSGVITFESAACLVIGSETGTAVKTILGAVGTDADKKRLAMGNMIINIVASMTAWIFLQPLTKLIVEKAGFADPLLALVMFQTVINLIGIMIFYPILKPFGAWLEKKYAAQTNSLTIYVNKLVLNEPGVALQATEKECVRLIRHVIWLNRKALEIRSSEPDEFIPQLRSLSYTECYETIKQLNGEILDFCLTLKSRSLNESELSRVEKLIGLLQKTMMSAKSVKDIRHNIKDYRDSANDLLHDFFKLIRKREEPFYDRCEKLFLDHTAVSQDSVEKLIHEARKEQNNSVQEIFNLSSENRLQDFDLATLMNVFEEVRNSHESLLEAISMLNSPVEKQ